MTHFLPPPDACNAHCHVFGPRGRFPYASDAPYVPAVDRPKEALLRLNDGLGLSRCVLVQPACHGADHSALEDVLAERPATYRGVALLPPCVSTETLKRLDACGFRAVRFNFTRHLGSATSAEDILALTRRLADIGWHVQLHGDPEVVLEQIVPRLLDSPVPVVIDHMARLASTAQLDRLLQRLDNRQVWIKVSGADRISRAGAPYADAVAIAQRLLACAGDRALWGSDWPHPNSSGPEPDDRILLDLVPLMAPAAELRQRLLVDNPQRLFGFG